MSVCSKWSKQRGPAHCLQFSFGYAPFCRRPVLAGLSTLPWLVKPLFTAFSGMRTHALHVLYTTILYCAMCELYHAVPEPKCAKVIGQCVLLFMTTLY